MNKKLNVIATLALCILSSNIACMDTSTEPSFQPQVGEIELNLQEGKSGMCSKCQHYMQERRYVNGGGHIRIYASMCTGIGGCGTHCVEYSSTARTEIKDTSDLRKRLRYPAGHTHPLEFPRKGSNAPYTIQYKPLPEISETRSPAKTEVVGQEAIQRLSLSSYTSLAPRNSDEVDNPQPLPPLRAGAPAPLAQNSLLGPPTLQTTSLPTGLEDRPAESPRRNNEEERPARRTQRLTRQQTLGVKLGLGAAAIAGVYGLYKVLARNNNTEDASSQAQPTSKLTTIKNAIRRNAKSIAVGGITAGSVIAGLMFTKTNLSQKAKEAWLPNLGTKLPFLRNTTSRMSSMVPSKHGMNALTAIIMGTVVGLGHKVLTKSKKASSSPA